LANEKRKNRVAVSAYESD